MRAARKQVQVPPATGEVSMDRDDYAGPIPRPFQVRRVSSGWCSACFRSDVVVVHVGSPNSFVCICVECARRIHQAAETGS